MLTHKKLLAHTSFKTNAIISLSYIPNRIAELRVKWIFNLVDSTKFSSILQ